MKYFYLSILLFSSALFSKNFPEVKIPLIVETSIFSDELKAQDSTHGRCMFATKDYQSTGFGVTYREGFSIKGQFGCVYYCGCLGKAYYVTHVYRKKYFDSAIWSRDTGGAKRAKWFICPHSVDQDSWSPIRDELGRIISYKVREDKSFFSPHVVNELSELKKWEELKCKN